MVLQFIINYFVCEKLHASFILPFNITIPKYSQSENIDSPKYNYQSFHSSCDNFFVVNGECFYFNDDGKLDIYYIVQRIQIVKKNN